MRICLRLSKSTDPDLYSFHHSVGEKMFREYIRIALKCFFSKDNQLPVPIVSAVCPWDLAKDPKVIRVEISERDPEICNGLEMVAAGYRNLFLKTILRRELFESLCSIYLLDPEASYRVKKAPKMQIVSSQTRKKFENSRKEELKEEHKEAIKECEIPFEKEKEQEEAPNTREAPTESTQESSVAIDPALTALMGMFNLN